MEQIYFFKNMSGYEEEEIREYFSKKIPKIEKFMSHFPLDGALLQLKAEKFQKHSAYDIELVLKMHGDTLTAREASHTFTKAIDLAKDRLEMQLKKAISSVRRTHRSIRARNKLKLRAASME